MVTPNYFTAILSRFIIIQVISPMISTYQFNVNCHAIIMTYHKYFYSRMRVKDKLTHEGYTTLSDWKFW